MNVSKKKVIFDDKNGDEGDIFAIVRRRRTKKQPEYQAFRG